MEMTLYLSEKFISKFEIFRAIAEEVNFHLQLHWSHKLDITFCREEFGYIFQFLSQVYDCLRIILPKSFYYCFLVRFK